MMNVKRNGKIYSKALVAPADEQNRLWTLPGKNSFISNT